MEVFWFYILSSVFWFWPNLLKIPTFTYDCIEPLNVAVEKALVYCDTKFGFKSTAIIAIWGAISIIALPNLSIMGESY